MAANAPPEPASRNACCLAWQGKYIDMKKRRDYCKEARDILQKALVVAEAEKAKLEKKLGELAADRDTKDNDSAVKASFEKEISGLKSEILSLQQRLEQNHKEIKRLQDQVSRGEKEINKLEDLLRKETIRADNSEEEREKVCKELDKAKALIVKNEDIKPHFPEVQEEISLVQNLLASEKHKTDSERKKALLEKKRADRYLSELEVLRTTAYKTSSDLLTLTSNLETLKKQLEFEKQKTLKEKKRADMENAKAREQMKLADGLSKKFDITRAKHEELKKEMELQNATSKVKFGEISAKLEEKIRLLEMNKKTAMDWKSRADDLTQQLQEERLVKEGLKTKVHELSLPQKSTEIHSVSPHKVKDLEKAEVRLLKKELKFEKKCAKHSKKVAEFEQFRREFQAEELGHFKMEFGSLTNRMKLLDEYILRDVEGTTGLGKAKGRMKLQPLQSEKNCNGEKHSDARCRLVASSVSQKQAHKLSAQLIPKSRRGASESVSGTISQLESPTGGSRKLQSSGVNSSATSFSDGQLLASQGREQVSVTTSAEIAKDKPDIQPTKSSMVRKTSESRENENLSLVAENYLQIRQIESLEVNEHSRKRKRMSKAIESQKHVSSDDRKKNLQTGEKLGTLQSMVADGPSANCITVSKKRRVSCGEKTIQQNSLELNRAGKTPANIAGTTQVTRKSTCLSTTKEHDAATLFLDDVATTDYMKLLELDNLEDENYYQMARESLLSPDLPQVDFLGGEIVNEEKKTPASALELIASNGVDLRDPIKSSETPSLNTQNASLTVKMLPVSTTLHGHIPEHFVVFSNNEDHNSIIKIFHATNNCIQRCPSVTIGQGAVPAILNSLKMEENLLTQERVCVLLSLLLHNFSVVSSTKIGDTLNVNSVSCVDSFSKHIYDVMADTEAGGMFSEYLEELLHLLQDVLSEQRILFSVKPSETSESDLSIPVTLNGENIALVSRIALIDHLVAGSAILAAICTAQDCVRFICQASLEILHKHNDEKTSALLTILHVFVDIAGEKMLSSREHDISLVVLKSIVMFLEIRYSDTVEGKAKLHRGKNKCPFSEGSSSLETVASMLVEILQAFTQSNTLHQSSTSSLGSSHLEKTEFSPALKDFQRILTRDQSLTVYHLCDVLSLLELIASYMAWDWTSVNIVAPLLNMMETALPVNLSVAIVSLVGQLGSIGVEFGGYGNEGISNMREKLSAFLQCETTIKAGFAVQIATVSSLLKMIQFDFSIVLEGKTTMLPCGGNQSLSSSVSLINKWFSLLCDEQRAFTSEFLQSYVLR